LRSALQLWHLSSLKESGIVFMEKRMERMELIHYVEILARRKFFVLGTTAAAFVLAVAVSLLLPQTYLATALVIPPMRPSGTMAALLGQATGLSGLGDLFSTERNGPDLYIGLLKTGAVKDKIIDRFDLQKTEKGATREELYKLLDRKVAVEAGRRNGIISIAVEDSEPDRAAEMANAYVTALEELTASLNSASAGKDRDFLEMRLAEAKASLIESEEALSVFKVRSKTVDVSEQGKATIEAVGRLHAELGAQEVRLAVLRQSMTENNPGIRAVRGAINNIKLQIADLEGAGKNSGAIPAVGAMPSLGQEYVRLVREFNIREALVELLARQYEVARIGEAKNITGLKVVQSAHVPEKKFKPRRTRIVLLTTYAAFIVAVLAAFVLERIESLSAQQKERWKRVRAGILGR
jgi:uncharacterized protein involved in exopolysaccharide biosynthesis